MKYEIHNNDCLSILRTLPDKSINCCVTSPPYYGLRDYGVDGQIGLEETPDDYVNALVTVFREVRRVLKDNGTLWLNLGDSYAGSGGDQNASAKQKSNRGTNTEPRLPLSSGVSANINNLLTQAVKEGVIFLGAGCSLTVAAKRDGILKHDKLAPKLELAPLLGVKRVFIKDGNNHLCQVFDSFTSISCLWVSASVSWVAIGQANADIVFDIVDDLGIVVTDHDLDTNTTLKVVVGSGATEHSEAAFTIKESAEPIAERISDTQPVRDSFTLDSLGESITKIDTINESVSFTDTLVPSACHRSDFRITKACVQQFFLALMGGRCEIAFVSVAHVFVSNSFGSFIRYVELYDKAKRKANSQQAKQELGIPEMVKRALMEDGWICRSTIIWSKPNPMPESVTDRPTKAHEYIFLLSKSQNYYYDSEAIKEDTVNGDPTQLRGSKGVVGELNGGLRKQDDLGNRRYTGFNARYEPLQKRNKRSVWTVTTKPYKEAHFATYPPDLILPCILAGCPEGGTVLDTFNGSGTTGQVALENDRNYIGIELNPEYVELSHKRLSKVTQKPKLFSGLVEYGSLDMFAVEVSEL